MTKKILFVRVQYVLMVLKKYTCFKENYFFSTIILNFFVQN